MRTAGPLAVLALAGTLASSLAVAAHAKSEIHEAPAAAIDEAPAPRRVPPVAAPVPPPLVMPDWSAADEEVGDAEHDKIANAAFAYVRRASVDEQRTLLTKLIAKDAPCTRAHSAALAGAVAGGIDTQLLASALETMDTECNGRIVETIGFSPKVDDAVAVSVKRLTTSKDDVVRRSAWLSYGSIATTARTDSDTSEIAARIDREIDARLGKTTGKEHILFVKAAGNAGCEACAPTLAKDATSSDPSLRKAAIAAHRFLTSTDAVTRLCRATAKDSDSTARDLAAWALEWRTTAPALRVQCLSKAANDTDRGVRTQAVRALGVLSDGVPEAKTALSAIADRSDDAGILARRTLQTSEPATSSDDALGTLLGQN